jgi:hypothetical protein
MRQGLKQMNTSKANTNKPWLSDEYDMPVLETEEIWSQRVIDEYKEDENVNEKEKD